MSLKDFVTDLTNDAAMWARFRKEPRAMMDEAGLTAEEKTLLTEGPIDALRARIGASPDDLSVVFIW